MTASAEVIASTVALGLLAGPLAAATQPLRPHVLLVYTDDQGYGDVSALNPESKFQTPAGLGSGFGILTQG